MPVCIQSCSIILQVPTEHDAPTRKTRPHWFRRALQHGGGGTARAAQLWPFHRARGGGAAGGSKKRVLVLMSDTGGGHRASAQAIKAGFEQLYGDQYHFDIVDMWTQHTYFPFNRAAGSYSFMVTTLLDSHYDLGCCDGKAYCTMTLGAHQDILCTTCTAGEVSHPVESGIHRDATASCARAGAADHGPHGRPLCVAGLCTVQARPGGLCAPADAGEVTLCHSAYAQHVLLMRACCHWRPRHPDELSLNPQGVPLRVLKSRIRQGLQDPVNFATVVTDLCTCHNTCVCRLHHLGRRHAACQSIVMCHGITRPAPPFVGACTGGSTRTWTGASWRRRTRRGGRGRWACRTARSWCTACPSGPPLRGGSPRRSRCAASWVRCLTAVALRRLLAVPQLL